MRFGLFIVFPSFVIKNWKAYLYFSEYFWTPRGQLLRNKLIIPVTNISELVEYVLPPHSNDVTKPRALNAFPDALAELGVDKGSIKNKKLLSDLIEKEKGYRNAENTCDNESNNEESSLDI